MRATLKNQFGEMYFELGIEQIRDVTTLRQKLRDTIIDVDKKLDDAEAKFFNVRQIAFARARERYEESDEKIQETLKFLHEVGFDMLGA